MTNSKPHPPLLFISFADDSGKMSDPARSLENILGNLTSANSRKVFNFFTSVHSEELYLIDANPVLNELCDYFSGDSWFAPKVARETAGLYLKNAMNIIIRDARIVPHDLTNSPILWMEDINLRASFFATKVVSPFDVKIEDCKNIISKISKAGRVLKSLTNNRKTHIFIVKGINGSENAILRIDICGNIKTVNEFELIRSDIELHCDGFYPATVDGFGLSMCIFKISSEIIDVKTQELSANFSFIKARDIYFGSSEKLDGSGHAYHSEDILEMSDNVSVNDSARIAQSCAFEGFSYRKARDLYFGVRGAFNVRRYAKDIF